MKVVFKKKKKKEKVPQNNLPKNIQVKWKLGRNLYILKTVVALILACLVHEAEKEKKKSQECAVIFRIRPSSGGFLPGSHRLNSRVILLDNSMFVVSCVLTFGFVFFFIKGLSVRKLCS